MATKRAEVVKLNNTVYAYLEQLSMSEEAKLEFRSKANSMTALESYQSPWFERFTRQLSQIVHQILLPRPQIDLNEPPAPQHNEVEDEARSNAHGKRKREGSQKIPSAALRIHEHNT